MKTKNRKHLAKIVNVLFIGLAISLGTLESSNAQVGTGKVKAALTWYTTDDLDLSITDPSGAIVSYSQTSIPSGGTLDVDANAGCQTQTTSPIENIFWNIEPPSGQYVATVDLYTNCPSGASNSSASIPVNFTLALRIGNETRTFTGTVSPGTRTVNFPFTYNGALPPTLPPEVTCRPSRSSVNQGQQLGLDITELRKRETQIVREINQIKKFTDLTLTELNNFDAQINDYRANIDILSGELTKITELGFKLRTGADKLRTNLEEFSKTNVLKISLPSQVEIALSINRDTELKVEQATISVNVLKLAVDKITRLSLAYSLTELTPGNIADFVTNYSQESADTKLRVTENSANAVKLLSQELRDLRRVKQQLIAECGVK